MTKPDPFKGFQSSLEIIRLAVMLYVRFPLLLRNVEDLLHECGIKISHETARFWWQRFGPMFASETHKKRVDRLRSWRQWRRHLDEMFSAGFARASPTMGTGQHGAQMRIGCGGDVTGDDLRLDAPAGERERGGDLAQRRMQIFARHPKRPGENPGVLLQNSFLV